jgi:hypothetical protein
MFKSSQSDPRSPQKGQKKETFEDRSKKQKMKPLKKEKYKPGTRLQDVDDDEE